MAKVYSKSTGLNIISGKVKSVSDDRYSMVVESEKYNPSTKSREAVEFTVKAPVTYDESFIPGARVTVAGYLAGKGIINADYASASQGFSVLDEGLDNLDKNGNPRAITVLSGEVLFANKRDELTENGQPKLNAAGAPRKPHFDVTIAVGTGSSRKTHIVKFYNFTDKDGKHVDNIGRMEKIFKNFDRKENPIYATFVTDKGQEYSYENEYNGNTYTNTNVSHMGAQSFDFEFLNARQKKTSTPAQDKTEEPAKTPEAEVKAEAPVPVPETKPVENDFGIPDDLNLDDLNIDDMDLGM